MKHISIYLQDRKRSLAYQRAQPNLFSHRSEKGMSEWSTFDTIREDRVKAYPVRIPARAIVTKEPRHVLRIAYPPAQNYPLTQP